MLQICIFEGIIIPQINLVVKLVFVCFYFLVIVFSELGALGEEACF